MSLNQDLNSIVAYANSEAVKINFEPVCQKMIFIVLLMRVIIKMISGKMWVVII